MLFKNYFYAFPQKTFWHIIIIIFLGFLVYANSLTGKFIYDDATLIVQNPYLTNWYNLPKIFTSSLSYWNNSLSNFYRPLQTFSYLIDYSLGKLNPFGYHITNIILHIAVSLCLYRLLILLFNDKIFGLLTALLFIIHPIHSEAVSYISGRADPLAALFLLLCFIFWIKNLQTEKLTYYLLIILFYTAALFSKENSLILLPLLSIIHAAIFNQRVPLKKILLLFLPLTAYIFLRINLNLFSFNSAYADTTLLQRLPGFFYAIYNYIRLIIFPVDLHMEYGNKLFSFLHPGVIKGILLVILSVLVFIYKKTNKLITFSLLWFFALLLPNSNIYPINAYMAEHWLYLPSLGFFMPVARGILIISSKTADFKRLYLLLITGIIITYGFLTIKQNIYWQNSAFFYRETLKYNPHSINSYYNLALWYLKEKNDWASAEKLFEKAIAENPDNYKLYSSIFSLYKALNKNDDFLPLAITALKLTDDSPLNLNRRAIIYYIIGKPELSLEILKKSLPLDPSGTTHNNLAVIYLKLGNFEKSLYHYNEAKKSGYPVIPELFKNYKFKKNDF